MHQVVSHSIPQDTCVNVLRETLRELLPALAVIPASKNRELTLNAAVVLLALPLISGDDVEGGSPILDQRDREAMANRGGGASILPSLPCVVGEVDTAVILLVEDTWILPGEGQLVGTNMDLL